MQGTQADRTKTKTGGIVNTIRKHLSFSNVVACLALFAALGGSAYAANKIGTNQLKNNAVTTAKIKKNAVTTAKIKNGAVTGAKVKVSSLGKVPSAATADTAGSAESASVAAKLADQENVFVKLNGGQSATLVQNGSVSLVASCVKNDGGTDRIRIQVATTQNGAVFGADDDKYGGPNPDDFLNTNTPENERDYEDTSTSTGETYVEHDIDSGYVLGPDGKMIAGNSEGMALGLNYLGADCIVAGVFNKLSQ